MQPKPTSKPIRATELQCQATIVDAAKRGGWLVHAERPAEVRPGKWATALQGYKGFPDLVLAHPDGVMMMVELKRKPNKVEPLQAVWHKTLADAGIDMRVVWVPEEMDAFCALLMDRRRR